MAEFIVKPEDYQVGGRLYNQPDIVVVSPEGVAPIIDAATGISYIPGSRAITVTKTTGGYGGLPKEVKDILGGSETGYNPFKDTTGYAFDSATGQFIVQNSPGNFGFLGGRYKKTDSGGLVQDFNLKTSDTSTAAELAAEAKAAAELKAEQEADAKAAAELKTKQEADAKAAADAAAAKVTPAPTIVSTYADPTTGDVTAVFSDGTIKVLAKSGTADATKRSAYDLLYQQFNDLGIGALVPDLKGFIEEGISSAEFTLRLRKTPSYEKRFAANAQRLTNGFRAISEAEYISLEDQYQDVMRQYGLPESYYARGEMGRQEGFEKFIAGNISSSQLEDRIMTAQKRVINANPEVARALKAFYPDISQGDILAYTLDPTRAIEDIKRKVTAAEISGAAARQGLNAGVTVAEQLAAQGVTQAEAQKGYATIADILPGAEKLSNIYGRTQDTYGQSEGEQEVFNSLASAQRKRQKLSATETGTFGASSGMNRASLTSAKPAGQY